MNTNLYSTIYMLEKSISFNTYESLHNYNSDMKTKQQLNKPVKSEAFHFYKQPYCCVYCLWHVRLWQRIETSLQKPWLKRKTVSLEEAAGPVRCSLQVWLFCLCVFFFPVCIIPTPWHVLTVCFSLHHSITYCVIISGTLLRSKW